MDRKILENVRKRVDNVERLQELLNSSRAMVVKLSQENHALRNAIGINFQRDVTDFHRHFGQHIERLPVIPPQNIIDFRIKLIDEEINDELIPALKNHDLYKSADGLVDGIYVLCGTAVSCGIDILPIWTVVHDYNMQKTPVKSEDGTMKPLKPDDLPHPDIKRELELQSWCKK